MIGIFIALMVVLGVGGTASVADNARPGDVLFGVDRAVENVRLSLAGEEKKNELRIKFAEERVSEIEDLSKEDDSAEGDDTVSAEVKEEKAVNVSAGIEQTLNLLADVKEQEGEDARIDDIITKLNAYVAGLPSDAQIEVGNNKLEIRFEGEDENGDDISVKFKEENGDDKSKLEIRTAEERIKIKMKNGVLEIKTKLEDDKSGKSVDTARGLEEAEAKIFPDKTIVEVEINDEKTTFTTSANTRVGIVAAILVQFPTLTSAQVEAVLKVEVEDGDDDADEEESDDDSDEDGDEDEDSDDEDDEDKNDNDGDDADEDEDDNSGSNSGSGSN